jgi:hypothetical protein
MAPDVTTWTNVLGPLAAKTHSATTTKAVSGVPVLRDSSVTRSTLVKWSDAPRTMNVRPDKRVLRISAKTRVNTTIHVIHNKTVKYKTINQFA